MVVFGTLSWDLLKLVGAHAQERLLISSLLIKLVINFSIERSNLIVSVLILTGLGALAVRFY